MGDQSTAIQLVIQRTQTGWAGGEDKKEEEEESNQTDQQRKASLGDAMERIRALIDAKEDKSKSLIGTRSRRTLESGGQVVDLDEASKKVLKALSEILRAWEEGKEKLKESVLGTRLDKAYKLMGYNRESQWKKVIKSLWEEYTKQLVVLDPEFYELHRRHNIARKLQHFQKFGDPGNGVLLFLDRAARSYDLCLHYCTEPMKSCDFIEAILATLSIQAMKEENQYEEWQYNDSGYTWEYEWDVQPLSEAPNVRKGAMANAIQRILKDRGVRITREEAIQESHTVKVRIKKVNRAKKGKIQEAPEHDEFEHMNLVIRNTMKAEECVLLSHALIDFGCDMLGCLYEKMIERPIELPGEPPVIENPRPAVASLVEWYKAYDPSKEAKIMSMVPTENSMSMISSEGSTMEHACSDQENEVHETSTRPSGCRSQ